MKLFFASRSAARRFASKNSEYKLVDMGAAASIRRRWAVKVK
jgi:hypothetical protein